MMSVADQDGHPGRVKREGAAGELKKGGGRNHFKMNQRGTQRKVKSFCVLCVVVIES